MPISKMFIPIYDEINELINKTGVLRLDQKWVFEPPRLPPVLKCEPAVFLQKLSSNI